MVRWMRWHCHPDTGFEIRAPAVWGRARYLSVKEAPHNIESLRVSGVKLVCQNGVRTRDFRLSKQATLTTAPGPPYNIMRHWLRGRNIKIPSLLCLLSKGKLIQNVFTKKACHVQYIWIKVPREFSSPGRVRRTRPGELNQCYPH